VTSYQDPIFRLDLICTGNRFRSPLAEGLLRTLAGDLPLELRSYGLYDLGPVAPLREALVAAERLRIDISGHRARPLQGESLNASDLVLGFERIHVATAVVEAQARRERSFTLPELVDLLGDAELPAAEDSLERARLAVRAADERRGARPPGEVLPEVPDPWSQPNAVYAETARSVAELCGRLVPRLFGDRRPGARGDG
jgi:protein-tyrosine phosphatase